MPNGLTFYKLRRVNADRATVWHKGGLDEWSVSDWAVAMAGEAGEVCDAVKKLRRLEDKIKSSNGPGSFDEAYARIGKEIADVVIYADLLATRIGFRLEDLIVRKFNEVSDRENMEHKL